MVAYVVQGGGRLDHRARAVIGTVVEDDLGVETHQRVESDPLGDVAHLVAHDQADGGFHCLAHGPPSSGKARLACGGATQAGCCGRVDEAAGRLEAGGGCGGTRQGGQGAGRAEGRRRQSSRFPRWGGLGNRMIQFLAARALADRVPGSRVVQIHLPEWGVQIAPAPPDDEMLVVTQPLLDLDRLALLLNAGRVRRVDIRSYAQRMENFSARETYADLFRGQPETRMAPDELLINIRQGDILDGHHPDYVLVPPDFYAELVARHRPVPGLPGAARGITVHDGASGPVSGGPLCPQRRRAGRLRGHARHAPHRCRPLARSAGWPRGCRGPSTSTCRCWAC